MLFPLSLSHAHNVSNHHIRNKIQIKPKKWKAIWRSCLLKLRPNPECTVSAVSRCLNIGEAPYILSVGGDRLSLRDHQCSVTPKMGSKVRKSEFWYLLPNHTSSMILESHQQCHLMPSSSSSRVKIPTSFRVEPITSPGFVQPLCAMEIITP